MIAGHRNLRGPGAMVAWVMLAFSVTACGVPGEAAPTPFDIGNEPEAPPSTTPASTETGRLYFVADDSVVPVERSVPRPAGPEQLLAVLLEGPTAAESEVGLRTSIPSGTTALDVADGAGTVAVDLSPEFAAVGGEEEILAVAQIVLTLTEGPGTRSVAFLLDGSPIAVPRPDGSLEREPVSFVDYDVLLPEG